MSEEIKQSTSAQNQCDGCMRGAPLLTNGLHTDIVTGQVFMACTKSNYIVTRATIEDE